MHHGCDKRCRGNNPKSPTFNRADRPILELLQKDGRLPIEQFRRAVQTWPEVVACHSMTGDMDYLLRVYVEDLDHFNRFMMNAVLKQSGVVDVKSSFALERVKDTTALPIPD